MKIIKYYYYYIFFNAYWSSFDIGENTVPRQNAVFYMSLLKIFCTGGISFLLFSIGAVTNISITILAGVAIILMLNYLLLSKKVFDKKYDDYRFLSKTSRKERLWLFFSVIIGAGILNVIGAFVFSL